MADAAKILKQSLPASELVNHGLIDAINNRLDVAAAKEALPRWASTSGRRF